MHFLGASHDGLVARRVDLDTISSSETHLPWSLDGKQIQVKVVATFLVNFGGCMNILFIVKVKLCSWEGYVG
jgi:hypothetical protein